MASASKYLKRFFEEKNLDLETVFEVAAPNGTVNYIPAQCVVDAILQTTSEESLKIANMLRRIDFANGDVMDYLRHLAKALAYDL